MIKSSTQQRLRKAVLKEGHHFFNLAKAYLTLLKESGKYNQYTPDNSRLNNFMGFLKHDHDLSEITQTLLERFLAHAKSKLGQSERSAVNHLVAIRSVFGYAKKQGFIAREQTPFGEGKMKIVFPPSMKSA